MQFVQVPLLAFLLSWYLVTCSNASDSSSMSSQQKLGTSSFNRILQGAIDSIVQARQEQKASEGVILINPLSWQLSSGSTPSLVEQIIPGIVDQPKAVIASAFHTSPGSNYSPGLRVPAGWSFSIGFHPVFFAPPSSSSFLTYSLRLQDGSDLPGWMEYNAEDMTLNGVTPWEEPSSQRVYRLRMIGTLTSYLFEDTGATVAQSFTIIVAKHTFEYIPSSIVQPGSTVLNLTIGGERTEQPFSFGVSVGSVTGLLLDGAQITESEIKDVSIDASAAAWAQLKPPTNVSPRLLTLFTSAAPSSKIPEKSELPIIVTDIYGETLQVALQLKYEQSVFRYVAGNVGWWNPVNLTIGQDFNIPLDQNFTREIPLNATSTHQQNALEVKTLPSWMPLHSTPLAISGTVPASIANQTLVTLTFRYTDPETFAVSRVKWNITLFSPPLPIVGINGNASGSDARRGLSRPKIIAITVFASLLGLVLLLTIAWFARKIIIARMLEKSKWASVLLPLQGDVGDHTNRNTSSSVAVWDSPPSFISNLKGQHAYPVPLAEEEQSTRLPVPPQPAFHRASSYHKRPSSPSNMLRSFIGTAMMTPTKKARKMVAEIKDRSLKRYTRSFMSYPIDYPNPNGNTSDTQPNRMEEEQDTTATELVSIHHTAAVAEGKTHAAPSPSPQRPISSIASLAPVPFIDPPLSGLPSTAFTSDSFLHGHHGHHTASPASWEEPADAVQVSHMLYPTDNVQYYAGSAGSIHPRFTIKNPEASNQSDTEGHGERADLQEQPPDHFLFAELCHQQSTILRSRDPTNGFPYSITSAGDSVVNVEDRYM